MDLEERVGEAQAYFRRLLALTKVALRVSEGEVVRRDNALSVTMDGSLVLSLTDEELLAPAGDEAFQTVLESTWRRELEYWESRHRKRQPRRGPRQRGERTGGRRPSGRSSS